MKTTRRQFMIYSASGLATLSLAQQAQAQALIAETEPQAVALGYKALATAVDKAKFPKYADGQICANCTLYQVKSPEAGGCAVLPGKLVAAAGWCNVYVKKA
ncbi:MAG: twin-arginine translocation pathway signal protein [Alcaligenaceae bacterium]|nr:MAG: twin-arginine translocation pathway signal protein [Alcaligenaceae bacterium]